MGRSYSSSEGLDMGAVGVCGGGGRKAIPEAASREGASTAKAVYMPYLRVTYAGPSDLLVVRMISQARSKKPFLDDMRLQTLQRKARLSTIRVQSLSSTAAKAPPPPEETCAEDTTKKTPFFTVR